MVVVACVLLSQVLLIGYVCLRRCVLQPGRTCVVCLASASPVGLLGLSGLCILLVRPQA